MIWTDDFKNLVLLLAVSVFLPFIAIGILIYITFSKRGYEEFCKNSDEPLAWYIAMIAGALVVSFVYAIMYYIVYLIIIGF